MTTKRNSTQRDRDRATIRRSGAGCHICGGAIDYSLPWLDPGAFVVDHVVPLARGGADVLANKKAAHRLPRVQQQEASPRLRTHRQAI